MSQQRMGFGPWSSSLDNGTRLELSAFWRRRMAGLARLPLGRIKRRWSLVTAIMAILVMVTPLVEFVSTPAVAEEAEAVEIPPGTAQLFSRAAPPNADERRAMDALQRRKVELARKMAESGAYTLAPGELVKFVSAERGGPLRREYAKLAADERQVTAMFHFEDDELQDSAFSYDQLDLAETLDNVLGVKLQQVEGDSHLLKLAIPEGDWVFSYDPREKPPLAAELVTAFEKTLQEALTPPVHIKLERKRRPVLVARGDYRADPMADEKGEIEALSENVAKQADGTFYFPARRGSTVGAVGTFSEFLDDVGELLLTPIVDEAAGRPAKRGFFWKFPEAPHVDLQTPLDEAASRAVTAAFEKQMGLTLNPEDRDVEILVITSGETEND